MNAKFDHELDHVTIHEQRGCSQRDKFCKIRYFGQKQKQKQKTVFLHICDWLLINIQDVPSLPKDNRQAIQRSDAQYQTRRMAQVETLELAVNDSSN
jgi:hypothetical protein